jgi:hypothetical protein
MTQLADDEQEAFDRAEYLRRLIAARVIAKSRS